MTIYLPDDLAETVKEHDDLNVSAVCQDALRRELARREEIAKLDSGMERVVVYVEEPYESDVAFVGKLLHHSYREDSAAYLTRRHHIAVYHERQQKLYQYDTFDDLRDDVEDDSELLAGVAAALGEKHVVELDI